MRTLTTVLDLAGAGLIVAGVALIWGLPALIVAGGFTLAVSWRLTR